ncbi:MAG TPA: HIT domain-containing protein [Thermoanaerobaculia bacterium]|nr:HIT domain-containing protein [Thermoanaerobaculia bacterium]
MTAPKGDDRPACIFCIAASSSDTRGTLTLYRDDQTVVMMNRYPYTNGHLMIAPVAHESRLFESNSGSLERLIRLTAEAQRILSDVYHPDGFNIGMNFGQVAGAGFADHYHMHVVPRWGGDANFMTVTAQTRLVPEDLESTFDKLSPHFRNILQESIPSR